MAADIRRESISQRVVAASFGRNKALKKLESNDVAPHKCSGE
jgi:hypothetical protein